MNRAIIAVLSALLLLAGCVSTPGGGPESVCEPYNETAMLARIPGTDWTGCDGDCKWRTEQGTGKLACVSDTCPKECSCRVFSRPKQGWDGDWKDEGEWKDPQEQDSGRRYRCWCVKAAT